MLQVFTKDVSTLVLDSAAPEKNIESVASHIKLCSCKNMTIDITNLNILDACRVSALCSTMHYMKYPDGQINWIVNSEAVEACVSMMGLGNSSFGVGANIGG
ncbi:MAG: hypothetical protein LUB59_01555 [Candidatus Gastranaerophilales bacterium]|nr:hypothetical protein [Candidatus Gastranaerophilales bacterium]